MRTYESLVDALSDLKKRGYDIDFRKEPTWIYCYVFDLWITPEQFNVDEVHRFEEDSNDNCVVYAISSYSGIKGTLIDSYGVYAEYMTFEMAQKFEPNYF
jgi:hypothetical protein